jgi:hypothetical protein
MKLGLGQKRGTREQSDSVGWMLSEISDIVMVSTSKSEVPEPGMDVDKIVDGHEPMEGLIQEDPDHSKDHSVCLEDVFAT